MAVLTAARPDPDADLEASLAEWRRFRRRKRLEEVHWIDALYQAYLTALIGGAAVLIGAGLIGDGLLTPSQLDQLTRDGHDWLNFVMAFVVAIGIRSGSRGGPIALERAEVRHVLLAPVECAPRGLRGFRPVTKTDRRHPHRTGVADYNRPVSMRGRSTRKPRWAGSVGARCTEEGRSGRIDIDDRGPDPGSEP